VEWGEKEVASMTTPGPAPPARGQQLRVLVTAASKYGATAGIAQAIAEALTERGLTATVLAPQAVDSVEGYDAVVLGSAVYSGHWLDPARELVARCGAALAARPVWLFSSGPVGDPSSKLVQKMGEDPLDVAGILAATKARGHRMFAGKLDRKNLGFAQRAALLAFRGMEGDFRDWAAIEAWAEGIARELAHLSASRRGG
jgi:menaquinone-dependent protoporphyrinogen oxidase